VFLIEGQLVLTTLLIKSMSLVLKSLVKDRVKTLVKPLDPNTLPRTFAAFSKFHLSTSNSSNSKVV
jgi:hypothetical protein